MSTARWNHATAKAHLENNGFTIKSERSINDGLGVQLVLDEGPLVNVFDTTGTVHIQGKKTVERERVETLFASPTPTSTVKGRTESLPRVGEPVPALAAPRAPPRVFIVYGHDQECKRDLELLLRRWKLEPVILSNLAPNGKTIIEALLAQAETDLSYVIVLLTPDDQGHPANKPEQTRSRARQNVVLEMGMFLGKLGRERVAILHKGNIELPSDIHGIIYIPFTTSISEVKSKLFVALHTAGLPVDVAGLSAE